jgi:hypothetical protein
LSDRAGVCHRFAGYEFNDSAGGNSDLGMGLGRAGVRDVEISTDGGKTWILAGVEFTHRWSWQRFTLTWIPETCGKYSLMSRVTDNRGEIQAYINARNCVYEVAVSVA